MLERQDRRSARPSFWRNLTIGFRSQALTTLAVIAILALIGAGPWLADRLSSVGLPGGPLVVLLIGLTDAAILLAVRSTFPSERRRRDLSRAASALGMIYRRRFVLPQSFKAMPEFNPAGADRGFAAMLSGHHHSGAVVVFDYGRAEGSLYAPATWRTCAAAPIRHRAGSRPDLAPKVIQTRGVGMTLNTHPGLDEVQFESYSFTRRWRVTTADRRMANALIDQRAMAWLLDLEGEWAFEVAGDWAICSRPLVPVERMTDLIDAFEGFRDRLPRVVVGAPDT